MMFTAYSKAKKIILTICLTATVFSLTGLSFASSARAQMGGGGGQNVPIGTDTDSQSIFHYMKDNVLDHLAIMVAKQLLHQLSASVINWINTGFKGNPSFMTNPQGFFLDAADQITGAFLSNGGPLSALCSPFSLDIRLNLALQQVNSGSYGRYACTLSTVIKNAKNAHVGISVGVNGQTVAGASTGGDGINAFVGGDFSQGGWSAFSAMTMQSQNNYMGAYYQAQSELSAKISARQNTIQADISMGNGFMSWETCKDVPANEVQGNLGSGMDQFEKTSTVSRGNGASYREGVDSNGDLTYSDCQTQTPGSAIGGTLQKNLDMPVEELGLVNDINGVVNALVTQLLTQMLSQGLRGLSGGGSGGQQSYTTQIIRDATSNTSANSKEAYSRVSNNTNVTVKTLTDVLATYDQASQLIATSKDSYNNAYTCFTTKLASSTLATDQNNIQINMAAIQTVLSTEVDPWLNSLRAQQANVQAQLDNLQSLSDNPPIPIAADSASSTQAQIDQSQAYIKNLVSISTNAPSLKSTASDDLKSTQAEAKKLNADAKKFQANCNSFIITSPSFWTNI